MPLDGERCRVTVPLLCNFHLFGGLRYHWGEELAIRCKLQVNYWNGPQRPWIECHSVDSIVGSTGPLQGDLQYSGLEFVVLGAFGPRPDCSLNSVYLQWIETIPVSRDHRLMPLAPWL